MPDAIRNTLKPNPDLTDLLDCCNQHPIAYRHLIRDMESPCPQLDAALRHLADTPPVAGTFYCNCDKPVSLLAQVRGNKLRIEGDLSVVNREDLLEWCRQYNPEGVATTHEPLMELLRDIVGHERWICFPTFTATRAMFREAVSHDIVRLTPDDRSAYEVFLQRTSGAGRHPSDNTMASEYNLMCEGHPIDCYAAKSQSDIAGVITISPMTDACDEVSRLVVIDEYRGRGLAKSLLSVGTRLILDRGRQPAYVAGGDRRILQRLLDSLGYEFVCHFWQRRYW